GRRIDEKFIREMMRLWEIYGINPAGEGGEFETFVLDAPFFRRGLIVERSHIQRDGSGGLVLILDEVRVTDKPANHGSNGIGALARLRGP
ncbi:MAG: hypothetical protein QXL32_05230, partial [Candidatus Bathyarchaeia archaeon]